MNEAPQGVKISAYIFFAMAALTLLGTCAIVALIGISIADTGGGEEMIGIVFALCFTLLFTLLYAGVGYGLLKMQSWARIAAIILAILSLCNFPIGTILGGVVLYFMFQQETTQSFS